MEINFIILGLAFDIVGIFILFLVTIFDYPHQRIFNQKEWWKRYWWQSWRPIFIVRPQNEKARLRLKWNCFIIKYGFDEL